MEWVGGKMEWVGGKAFTMLCCAVLSWFIIISFYS